MVVINKKYLTIDELSHGLDLTGLDPQKSLIQIFSGYILESEIKQIQSIIKQKNEDIIFIGTTTAGEIFEGDSLEKTIVVSIIKFETTTIKENYFNDLDDFQLGKKVALELIHKQTKAMILFIDGLQSNGNDIIDGISSINNTIPIAGGLAGEDGKLVASFIFDQNGVYSKGCVAIALQSNRLKILNEYQLNWQAIGQVMTVTKANKNRLYELNGVNASEMYTRYLGENIGKNLPYSAVEFPLLKIDDEGFEICRTFVHQFDDGSLLTIGNLEVGDKVRFSFGNVDLILKSTNKKLRKYKSFHPDIIFVYSCAARKSLLQSKISQELAPLNAVAPNVGFFTYGEIYHLQKKNALLNESFTILALSENDVDVDKEIDFIEDVEKEKTENIFEDKYFLVLDALTHLSNKVIEELEEARKELEDQSNRDFLTGLYNRRYFNEISKSFMRIAWREKRFSAIISLDIDNFKRINDTYGHDVGDIVIKKLADIMRETVRKSDIISRFGGEEFIILLPFTDLQGAYKTAEKLRKNVQNNKLRLEDGTILQFSVSIGVDAILESDNSIEEALKRADNALYEAKRTGKNKVVLYQHHKG